MGGHDGAAEHFSAYYRAYYPLILAACVRRLGVLSVAEDAAQEVFRIAWQRFASHEPDLAWLYAIARNVIVNEYRRTARAGAAQVRLQAAERNRASAFDSIDIHLAMAQLRPAHRELLYLTYWLGLDAHDVGERLGISVGAVWVRLTRARLALRLALLRSEPEL